MFFSAATVNFLCDFLSVNQFSLIGKVCVKNIDPYLEELKVLVNVTKDRVSIIFDSLSVSQGYSLKQKPSEISNQIVKQSEKHMEQVLC